MPGFKVPNSNYFADALPLICSDATEDVISIIQGFFEMSHLYFNPADSENVIEQQVQDIVDRIPKSSSPSMSQKQPSHKLTNLNRNAQTQRSSPEPLSEKAEATDSAEKIPA